MTWNRHHNIVLRFAIIGLVIMALPAGVGAQQVDFEPLLWAPDTVVLLPVDGHILGGVYKAADPEDGSTRSGGGGIIVWDLENPGEYERWFAGDRLSSNAVVDLSNSGQHIWAATDGGGLTRIGNIDAEPEFRHFFSLGGLKLTAVTGTVIEGNERVYYGIHDAGVGVVNDGFPGQVYTAELHGLIDNRINDLLFWGDELFVATPSGISRFADNLFSDQNTGLPDLNVNVLALDFDGSLLAGTDAGVARWDGTAEQWELLFTVDWPIIALDATEPEVWAVARGSGGFNLVARWWRADQWAWAGPSAPGFEQGSALAVVDREIFYSGRYRDVDTMPSDCYLTFLGRRTDAVWSTWIVNEPLVLVAEGVTIDNNDTVWMGDLEHVSIGGYDGENWTNIYQLAADDSTGLWNNRGAILSMVTAANGDVWLAQYGWGTRTGKIAFNPDADDGSPGNYRYHNNRMAEFVGWGNSIVRLAAHPDGAVIFLHDNKDAGLVEVLIDPEHYRNPESWIYPRDYVGSTLGGADVWAALAERRDVIWFAVQDLGLVRWDLNGLSAGPDDPLTWLDQTDDDWQQPLAGLSGSSFDPRKTRGLALAPDGAIWAGGGPGVARFTYAPASSGSGTTENVASFSENIGTGGQGLLAGGVGDVVVDGNGDAWVTTEAGINRIRRLGGAFEIDAFTDPVNYFAHSHIGRLYSVGIMSSLPGGTYYKFARSLDGFRIAVGSDRGAALLTIEPYEVSVTDELAQLYLFPNPFVAGGDTQLKLGGINADPNEENPAKVRIYNLEGQLVYRNSYVADATGFWDGTNRSGQPVSSGLYRVRVELAGEIVYRTLAVVR